MKLRELLASGNQAWLEGELFSFRYSSQFTASHTRLPALPFILFPLNLPCCGTSMFLYKLEQTMTRSIFKWFTLSQEKPSREIKEKFFACSIPKNAPNLLKSIQQYQFSNNSYKEFNLCNIKCLCEIKEVILKWSQSFMVFRRKDLTQSLRLSAEWVSQLYPNPCSMRTMCRR